jgi:hypothetical protein
MATSAHARPSWTPAGREAVVAAVALASLVVSYGQGLFGWQEGGFRTPVELAVVTELGAVVLLAAALTGELALPRGRR